MFRTLLPKKGNIFTDKIVSPISRFALMKLANLLDHHFGHFPCGGGCWNTGINLFTVTQDSRRIAQGTNFL